MIKQSIRKMHVKAIKMRWLTGGVNYSYLLSTQDKKKSWLIDPAETLEVMNDLGSDEAKSIEALVNTHHHYDHAGGNVSTLAALNEKGNNISRVIAGSQRSPIANDIPDNLHEYTLGNLKILCIRTPCHTQDSTCYYVRDPETKEQAIFTGDTLFTGGCGRFFEGTAEEMDDALNFRLLGNTGDTSNWKNVKVYPGHEYTAGNVSFIRNYIYLKKSDNDHFNKLESFTKEHEVTTGHFTIADELSFNPFMRLDDPIVRRQVGDSQGCWTRAQVMDKLRNMKNKA
ncbi:hydroxyacylglutathione hydrolase GLO4 [Kluyveromyces lactis]|uniref:hydroxyacylglutathione hydrolase n=1 Tax=Kluyveromyces lactis (strain ATCC 8585 / CBS 2359 / DSM 70799 / NBRC 1267 / NRRL Y-1140 / WM37) TaxID=284590 RepID=Q6CJT8_KLULA|nr:uncharacterized protein KLLA0_F16016g [Kluyveromyces lactis]CAG98509.1 KLLA0F16016p [Kluyveromyces lactis]|eukprot:XP_455801.1 uncharacterized protein KLLA0_F16016g [Kluyveromyces lactis]